MKKYTLCLLEAVDYKTAQRWLDDMARKGWELERCNRIFAAFRRVEDRPVRHFADLAAGWEDREDYLQLCADAGWERVSKVNGMDLFRALPGREVTPIQSDKGMEGRRYFRKKLAVEGVLLIVLFLVLAFLVPWLVSLRTDWRMQLLTSTGAQLTGLAVVLFALHLLWTLVHSLGLAVRYGRDREAPRSALPLCRARVALYWVSWLLYLLGQVLFPLFGLLFTQGVSVGMDTPTDAQWSVVEEAPVPTLERLGGENGDTFVLSLHKTQSFLVEGWDYAQCAGADALWCERYTCVSADAARQLVRAVQDAKAERGQNGYGVLTFSPQELPGADESWTARAETFVLLRRGTEVAFVGWRTGEETPPITRGETWERLLEALEWEETP